VQFPFYAVEVSVINSEIDVAFANRSIGCVLADIGFKAPAAKSFANSLRSK
jgi:hypothetical protein